MGVTLRRLAGDRWHRPEPPARADAVRGELLARVRESRSRRSIHGRGQFRGTHRTGRQGRSRLQPDARSDRESRLRAGRSGPGRSEPVGVRDLLRRAAPVLRRRQRSADGQRQQLLLFASHRRPARRARPTQTSCNPRGRPPFLARRSSPVAWSPGCRSACSARSPTRNRRVPSTCPACSGARE